MPDAAGDEEDDAGPEPRQCDIIRAGRYLCDQLGNTLSSVLGYSLIFDNRNGLRATRGQRLTFSQDFAGLGGDVKYLRTRGDATKYFEVRDGWVVSTHAEGGYIQPLTKSPGPGRDAIFFVLLAGLMVPDQVLIVPRFVIMRQLGWLDTYQGLIVPLIFSSFGAFLLRQYFLGIPRDFQEAATIEGANPFRVYWDIYLPLARPALAAFGFLAMLYSWNEFLWALTVTSSSDMRVLSVGLALFQGQYFTNNAVLLAAANMATFPLLIAFLFFQKQLVEGITLSGIK